MKTTHRICYEDSKDMNKIEDESVDLMITSPPYPMIEMWDEIFSLQNPSIKVALENQDGNLAFDLMHKELDKVWKEVARVHVPGGIVCVNIGDATRTINKVFRLYPSHVRIVQSFLDLGFQSLPGILWRKPTNAPNKFMGSGMLPPGAYVTLEHEHILIFRKGNKKEFKDQDKKQNRQESSYFWEERNRWFSDVWELKGEKQILKKKDSRRLRSGAFPFELAFRLISMFSAKGDIVLDPFLGTGTTTLAAMATCRSSIGYEIDQNLELAIQEKLSHAVRVGNNLINKRISLHQKFIKDREKIKPIKYTNINYNFPVITAQEQKLRFANPKQLIKKTPSEYIMEYEESSKK
jgi:DNA modification methylase